MKKTLSIVLAVLILITLSVTGVGAVANDTTLKFNGDGEFRIMMFADIQDDENLEETTAQFMREALDRYQPDLVIYLGDNTCAEGYEKQERNVENITAPVRERNIPYAIVFGNHDDEFGVSKEELLQMFTERDCLTYDAVPEMHGCGTCNLPIYSSDGEKVAFNLWLTDSGTYNTDEGAGWGYDYVHEDTLQWYRETAAALAEENGGEPVPAMNFQHIVIPEIYDKISFRLPFAIEGLTCDYFGYHYSKVPVLTRLNGYWLEQCCPPSVYDGQLDAWVETGDVIAAFHGHDHNNSYEVNIDGVDVINVPTVGCSSYCKEVTRGAGLITLNENSPTDYDYELVHFYDFALSSDTGLTECEGYESRGYYAFYKALDTFVQIIFKLCRIFAIDRII